MKNVVWFSLVILFCGGASAQETPDAETTAILKSFSTDFFAAIKDVHAEVELVKASAEIDKVSKRIPDEKLASVELFALSDDGKSLQWPLAKLLVERGRFDAAAHIFVTALGNEKEPRYGMWKWWETCFGERKDYLDLSRKIGIAFMHQFDIGDASAKLVVAQLFDKGEAEAKLSVDDFKKAIDFDKKIAK